MEAYFRAAMANVYMHGDTDIFPFPLENRILFDQIESVIPLLLSARDKFESTFSQDAPHDIKELVPVGHTGFRNATQLDPFWNVFLLGSVISIADRIENARLSSDIVFSYRLDTENYLKGDLFRRDIGWIDYYRQSSIISEDSKYIVVCDIADCYGRISHHKLDNALRLIKCDNDTRAQILKYLSYTTGTKSSGLPVGGPASRILAELALNNVDQYLRSSALAFVRYADDYHLFYDSKQEAYLALRTISETLGNEGLVLQRSKTRILTKAEFSAQVASVLGSDEAQPTPARRAYGAIPSVRSIFR